MISETSILRLLKLGEIVLPPLSFCLVKPEPVGEDVRRFDALVEGKWEGGSEMFAVEVKAFSTPKVFAEAVALLKTVTLPKKCRPLLIVPFLKESQLHELETARISGVDLCGNGVIVIPHKLTILRTGRPNRFPASSPIKNVYHKNSSMVGRMLLVRQELSSVKEAVEETGRRDYLSATMRQKSLTFSTVSKVLAEMEQDLIIERGKNLIRLLQPDKLLGKLSDSYTLPANEVLVKVDMDRNKLLQRLSDISREANLSMVATGLSSVSRYAVMEGGGKLSVFCPSADALLNSLPHSAPGRVSNLGVVETQDATAYYDAVEEEGFFWASPVQTYLELMCGDKRDQETAEQVKTLLLGKVREA